MVIKKKPSLNKKLRLTKECLTRIPFFNDSIVKMRFINRKIYVNFNKTIYFYFTYVKFALTNKLLCNPNFYK